MLKLSQHLHSFNTDSLSNYGTIEYLQKLKDIKDLLKQREMKIFRRPTNQYVKYTKKKLLYQHIYHRSAMRYYTMLTSQILLKIFRKKLQYYLINTTVNIIIWYCLNNTGLFNIIYKKLKQVIGNNNS